MTVENNDKPDQTRDRSAYRNTQMNSYNYVKTEYDYYMGNTPRKQELEMSDLKQTFETALTNAQEKGDLIAAEVIQDALSLLALSTKPVYTTGVGEEPAIEHVAPHLGRAVTNILRNPRVRGFIPSGSVANSGGVTPRNAIITKSVEDFMAQYERNSDNGRTAYDDDQAMLNIIEGAVRGLDNTHITDYWKNLNTDAFRVKIVRTDVRKALADYIPPRPKVVRTAKPKTASERSQVIALAAPYIAENYGKYPTDNSDLDTFIVESIEGRDDLKTYWTGLKEFNKLLVYADVRKVLTREHGINAPTKGVPAGVEGESTPSGEPVVSGIESTTKAKAARKSRKNLKNETETPVPPPEDNTAMFEEAVVTAFELYGDDDQDAIRERMRQVMKDGSDGQTTHWVEEDRGEFGESHWHGTIISQSNSAYFVLADEE